MTIGDLCAEQELSSLSAPVTRAAEIGRSEFLSRIDRARALTDLSGAQALLVNAGTSLRYFTGLSWGASERLLALVVPVRGEPFLVCPHFELGSLEAELAIALDMRSWQEDQDPIALLISGLGEIRLSVDPAVSFSITEKLRQAAPRVALADATPIIDGCRMYKSEAEIALMQQAKSITLEVQRRTARILEPGITTTSVKRFIDDAHRAMGTAGYSFCIVQFGRATAFPHGLPGEQTLAEGDLVLIDTGCTIEGYHADITRSYVFGQADDEMRAIWELEKQAQAAAFAAAVPGAPCEAVDAAARAVISAAGLGPDYDLPGLPHRTGHGIGLNIHEAPYLVRGDRTPLATGMCFSNEPMIVVPGRFGIRLEDHFYMTADGPRWFTEPQAAFDRLD